MNKTCIIIGASHAGSELAIALRKEGWEGKILVISDDTHLPYHRPPLSKDFLSGEREKDSLLIRAAGIYEKQEIEFLLGVRVEKIDRAQKTVQLKNGEAMAYDKLAFCTGARVLPLRIPGAELDGVCYLRDMKDAEAIRAHIVPGGNAVIIGAGYIGLEAAASLTKLGMKVTVLEREDRVLKRVTDKVVADFFTKLHTEAGVTIHTSSSAHSFVGQDRVEMVELKNGQHLPADLVLVGIGVRPNSELAEAIGLEVNDGIVVDKYARTADPDIVAAGDCTSHPNALYGWRLRLESVPNAMDQAKSAAASICGIDKEYNSLPWFWSDQYDVTLQIAGLNLDYDQVVVRHNSQKEHSMVAWYLREGIVIAADCINYPKAFMAAKRFIPKQPRVDPAALSDETVDLKTLLKQG